MKVNVQFEAQLRQVAGADSTELDLPEESDLLTALRQAAESGGKELQDRLLTPQGSVQSALLVFVNDQPVPASALESQPLRDGDSVLLLPPISGG